MEKPARSLALLLEDEPLIAIDLEATLSDLSVDVVSLASRVEALDWLADKRPDVAIVDIALRDGPSDQVVERLDALNVPFIVHSGSEPMFHAGTVFRKGIWIGKPASHADMIATIRRLLGG